MYICSCFGITEKQVREHADSGAVTPRQIAGACKAGTDCGSCVRRIQALLGRGACSGGGPREAPRGRPVPLAAGVAGPAVAAGVRAQGAAGPAEGAAEAA